MPSEEAVYQLNANVDQLVEEMKYFDARGSTLAIRNCDEVSDGVSCIFEWSGPYEDAALGVRCGWHGDVDAVPAGFASELALWAGRGPRAALESHARVLRERHATRRPSRYADDTVARLDDVAAGVVERQRRLAPRHLVAGGSSALVGRSGAEARRHGVQRERHGTLKPCCRKGQS